MQMTSGVCSPNLQAAITHALHIFLAYIEFCLDF